MQMFKKPVTKASQGDRTAVLVTQLDAKSVERAIVCSPGICFSFHSLHCFLTALDPDFVACAAFLQVDFQG